MCKKVAKKVSGHDTMTMVKRRPAWHGMIIWDSRRIGMEEIKMYYFHNSMDIAALLCV